MRILIMSLLLAATAACGRAGDSDANRAAEQAPARNVAQEVGALPEGQRNAVFIRAIRDAGQDCQFVQSSRPGGTYRGMPVWEATCRGGGHWTIVVSNDGTAQILNADQATLVTDSPNANSAGPTSR